MTLDLFGAEALPPQVETLAPGAAVLRGFAGAEAASLLEGVAVVTARAPWRHMEVPGGHRMSVAMSNCGELGWVADRRGYRYDAVDPESGERWPAMPAAFVALAARAAEAAGFAGFAPDACLINRYRAGAKLSLHQDRDERDFGQPIVSVSLGLPAVFLFGGMRRDEPTRKVALAHGDVVVWGGEDRLRYHGVAALKAGLHPATGEYRINLTFRRAG